MSEPETPARPFYVTGGTLKPGEPSYVERRADTELIESLLAGDFCYVLTGRQMGKSSLMARTATRLEQAGVASAIVDLTQIGSERGKQGAEQWYFGIANKIHQHLKIEVPLRLWWQERSELSPVQRLTDFFRELVLAHCLSRVVIFVDEIDSTIGLPFAADFFAALRACFNARATEPVFERLNFVLLGVATPDQLIQDPTRTPFNIGNKIDLTDFSPDEARTLAPGLHADPGEAARRLERILYWTGGHPYLSQALCRAVRERTAGAGAAETAVDTQVEELFLSSRGQREETNLKHARARLEKTGPEGRRLLQLYRRVRQGKPIPDQPTSPLFAQLKLAGVVKATDEGRLAVRNRVYEAVFTPEWARSAMPADRGRQLAAATLAASLVGVLIWYAIFQPRPYEEAFRGGIQADAYNVAFDAYTHLRANPFSRSRATELMQQFWEQRGLRYALAGRRDESLLSFLECLSLKDSEKLRRRVRNLVGPDYERLRLTFRHAESVGTVAFSPDGRTIATGSNRTARLWDSVTGKLLGPPLNHDDIVVAVAFSGDGRTLETADGKTVQRWDVVTGKPLASPLRMPQGGPHENAKDRTQQVFVSVTGKRLVLPMPPPTPDNFIAFNHDGGKLATSSANGVIRVWNAVTGKPVAPPLQSEYVNEVAFSFDGQTLATMDNSGTIRLWDAFTSKPFGFIVQQEGHIGDIAFSRDGRTLATATWNGIIRLWDAVTYKPLAPSLHLENSIIDIALRPDGKVVATAPVEGTARLWDTFTGIPLTPPLWHKGAVLTMAFSPDGGSLVTGSNDGTARLWGAGIGRPLAPRLQSKDFISVVALSRSGQIVATGSADGTVHLWNAVTGQLLKPTLKHESPVSFLGFSPDGRTLATGSNDGTTRLWETITGRLLLTPWQHEQAILIMSFSPNGRVLATGSSDNTTRLWDTVTGKPLAPSFKHRNPVLASAFSPDGRILATSEGDNTVCLWNMVTGKPIVPLLKHESPVVAMSFSTNGGTLATGSRGRTIHLWDTTTGKSLTEPLRIQGRIRTLAFSPDGTSFFVATDNRLDSYSWDGKKSAPQSSQLLHGFWKKAFRFPSDCKNCVQVALEDTGNSFHLETLHLDEPVDSPIEGDPKELLEKWEGRLGLKFDEQMRPVPAVDLPQETEGLSRRRSPGVRQR